MVGARKMEAQLESVNKALSEMMQQLADLRQDSANVARRLDRFDVRFSEHDAEIAAVKNGREPLRAETGDHSSGSDGEGVTGEDHQNPHPHIFESWRKIDLPSFNGDEAFAWVDKAERFFRMSGLPEVRWVSTAFLAMEGRALTWFRWWESDEGGTDWEAFKRELLRRFQPAEMADPFSLLLRVRQEGTVREYREKFESLAGAVELADRRYLRIMFLNGLREEITAELSLHSFDSLKDMMTMAERVDERNRLYSGSGAQILFGGRGGARERGVSTGNGWGPPSRSLPPATGSRGTSQESVGSS